MKNHDHIYEKHIKNSTFTPAKTFRSVVIKGKFLKLIKSINENISLMSKDRVRGSWVA